MMYAKKLKMQPGCNSSTNVQEIAEIYIDGCDRPRFFPKALVHDHLMKNPGTIKVYISPYPDVIPATSIHGEKYVKSSPDYSQKDNLLNLSRDR